MTATGPEKYDVAFSFLYEDIGVAREFADLVEPELSTFVFDRKQEEVGGGDGMTAFAQVFKDDARLTVILLRDQWGKTRWTAVEEAAVKERALDTGFRSFMIVAMEESIVVRKWIPAYMIYQHGWREPRAETAAVIRARARDAGAVLKTETLADQTRRRLAESKKKADREAFLSSADAARAARAEYVRVCEHTITRLQQLAVEIPELQVQVIEKQTEGFGRIGCRLRVTGDHGLSIYWSPEYGHSLTDAYLHVGRGRGNAGYSWSYYSFTVLPSGEYGWRYEPNADRESGVFFLGAMQPQTTEALVEECITALVEKALGLE